MVEYSGHRIDQLQRQFSWQNIKTVESTDMKKRLLMIANDTTIEKRQNVTEMNSYRS